MGYHHVAVADVDADEVFVVEPESSQRASNPNAAEEPAVVLAIGAPAVDDVHASEP